MQHFLPVSKVIEKFTGSRIGWDKQAAIAKPKITLINKLILR